MSSTFFFHDEPAAGVVWTASKFPSVSDRLQSLLDELDQVQIFSYETSDVDELRKQLSQRSRPKGCLSICLVSNECNIPPNAWIGLVTRHHLVIVYSKEHYQQLLSNARLGNDSYWRPTSPSESVSALSKKYNLGMKTTGKQVEQSKLKDVNAAKSSNLKGGESGSPIPTARSSKPIDPKNMIPGVFNKLKSNMDSSVTDTVVIKPAQVISTMSKKLNLKPLSVTANVVNEDFDHDDEDNDVKLEGNESNDDEDFINDEPVVTLADDKQELYDLASEMLAKDEDDDDSSSSLSGKLTPCVDRVRPLNTFGRVSIQRDQKEGSVYYNDHFLVSDVMETDARATSFADCLDVLETKSYVDVEISGMNMQQVVNKALSSLGISSNANAFASVVNFTSNIFSMTGKNLGPVTLDLVNDEPLRCMVKDASASYVVGTKTHVFVINYEGGFESVYNRMYQPVEVVELSNGLGDTFCITLLGISPYSPSDRVFDPDDNFIRINVNLASSFTEKSVTIDESDIHLTLGDECSSLTWKMVPGPQRYYKTDTEGIVPYCGPMSCIGMETKTLSWFNAIYSCEMSFNMDKIAPEKSFVLSNCHNCNGLVRSKLS